MYDNLKGKYLVSIDHSDINSKILKNKIVSISTLTEQKTIISLENGEIKKFWNTDIDSMIEGEEIGSGGLNYFIKDSDAVSKIESMAGEIKTAEVVTRMLTEVTDGMHVKFPEGAGKAIHNGWLDLSGKTGVANTAIDGELYIMMDEKFPILEEWDNHIIYNLRSEDEGEIKENQQGVLMSREPFEETNIFEYLDSVPLESINQEGFVIVLSNKFDITPGEASGFVEEYMRKRTSNVETPKSGPEVEMEHIQTLKRVASGEITPEQGVIEISTTHEKERKDYYEQIDKIEKGGTCFSKDEYQLFRDGLDTLALSLEKELESPKFNLAMKRLIKEQLSEINKLVIKIQE